MVHILVEESYTNNNRLSLILDGISSVIKKKRIAIKLHKRIETLPDNANAAMVIYASLKWVTEAVKSLNEKRVHPLLFGVQDIDSMYKYSGITFTFTKTTYLLTKCILAEGVKGKTAFVGYNDDSFPDELKMRGAEYAAIEAGEEFVVFKNRGNVGNCIRNFLENGKDVKNIVCGNDSIAVILRSLYPEFLEGKKICSCSGLKMSKYVENPYPTTFIDYYEAGKRLAELYLFVGKSDEIVPTVMSLELGIRVGTEVLHVEGDIPESATAHSSQIIDYYGDESVQQVENFDRMLLNCDEMDFKILKGLMNGLTYEQVAERNYFSANTVKYRVHLMMKNGGGYDSKRELLDELKKYGLKL